MVDDGDPTDFDQINGLDYVIANGKLRKKIIVTISLEPIRGWEDKASAAETVDSGSIPGLVKPKSAKVGFHSFPARRSAIKGTV